MTAAQRRHGLSVVALAETLRACLGRDADGRPVLLPGAAGRLQIALDLHDVTARHVLEEAEGPRALDGRPCCRPSAAQIAAEAYGLTVSGGVR